MSDTTRVCARVARTAAAAASAGIGRPGRRTVRRELHVGRARWLAVAAVALAVVFAASACGGQSETGAMAATTSAFAGDAPSGLTAPNFTLHDQSGQPISLSGERGHWVVVTFFYTHCPDVCPLIADQLSTVFRELGANRVRLRVLAVSVDPTGDTPSAVHNFIRVHRLPEEFRYLTGTRPELEKVWSAYHVAAQTSSASTSVHTAYEMLIDPTGQPRLLYSADLRASDLLHDLRLLGVTT